MRPISLSSPADTSPRGDFGGRATGRYGAGPPKAGVTSFEKAARQTAEPGGRGAAAGGEMRGGIGGEESRSRGSPPIFVNIVYRVNIFHNGDGRTEKSPNKILPKFRPIYSARPEQLRQQKSPGDGVANFAGF